MNKNRNIIKTFLIVLSVSLFSCSSNNDPLPSWNQTEIKDSIIDFVNNKSKQIPVEDRIAVFDMDGTIACEHPLWFEMAVASQRMADKLKQNPALDSLKEYQYAKKLSENPNDTTVFNHWVVDGKNYLDSIVLKAFEGDDYETYVDYAKNYLNNTKGPKYGNYSDLFYQPMLELIKYLQSNQFQVYIVSGSTEGVMWGVCPQNIGFDRQHLIGTNQTLSVVYPKDKEAQFIIQKSVNLPKNNYDGKSMNIYSRLGKIPVMAVGNTTGDFGMFRLVSTSKYPHFAMMLNHDDDEREYSYVPYYGTPMLHWQDTLRLNNWKQADMSKEFKTVWKIKSNK